jgi:pheromone shutdown protein TraB
MACEVTLVGVGHVFDLNEKITQILHEKRPDIIAVELDRQRCAALLSQRPKKRQPFSLPILLFAVTQRIIARRFGTLPGAEMRHVLHSARRVGITVALIDMNAATILNRLWNRLSPKKKIAVFVSLFFSAFTKKETLASELEALERDPDNHLARLAAGFPEFKQVLVDERNEYMAQRLYQLANDPHYERILAFVGEGHVSGLLELLAGADCTLRCIHLHEMLQGTAS